MVSLDVDAISISLDDIEYIPSGHILTNRSSVWDNETDRSKRSMLLSGTDEEMGFVLSEDNIVNYEEFIPVKSVTTK